MTAPRSTRTRTSKSPFPVIDGVPLTSKPPFTDTERRLADELHTHQVELQMQNDELVRAKQELERSRARYFELYDFAPVAYFTISGRGIIESLNLAGAELLRIDRQRAIGTPLGAYVDETSKSALRGHLELIFDGAEKHALDLVLAGDRGAARRHVHFTSRRARGESGDPPLCLSAAIDITARKVAEEEVTRLNTMLEQSVAQRTRELEESNKELEAFIYSISHDLRAPLRNMAGFATLISDDYAVKVPPEVLGYVRRIQAGNEKMLHLVDDLLRFSRLGRKPLDVEPTDLNALLDEALSDLGAEMAGRDIQWRRTPLPIADCDRALMRQVFVNFLSNALKYSRPRRPAVIAIGTEVHEGQPTIFIRDNGVGFDMRYRDKLFGVFQRLHVQSEFEGNGVGLAMVARILARHGGHAFADSRPEQGATFWFTFEGLKQARA